jgi:hypothetical protein
LTSPFASSGSAVSIHSGVGERADEHAEHDLVRAIAQEVAQQPR